MAYFHCLIGGGSSGGGYELTVTCDADFAGTTITCTDGVTTLTQTCPSSSPYEVVFAIPNGGEWTISGIISGQTYSTAIDIPDSLELHSVPEGSTVLPTDDIQTWLACAEVTDKSYTTLNEVLADSTTLLALMSNNNAVDYLVRSTTWANGITADSTAMTDIGASNYCANTLLSDSTWAEAICNSTYFESVLNTKVPTMTSNTTPSGVCSGVNIYASAYDFWRAFDQMGVSSNGWLPTAATAVTDAYIEYQFTELVKVVRAGIWNKNQAGSFTFAVKGSQDGQTFTEIDSGFTVSDTGVWHYFNFANDSTYQYYRIYFTSATQSITNGNGWKFQFIGRAEV